MPIRILVYDSDAFGHHTEFIEYFLDFLEDNSETSYHISFIFNKNTLDELRDRIFQFKKQKLNVVFIPIDNKWQNKFDNSTSTFTRSLLEKKYLEGLFIQYQIVNIVFLQIDIFQFVIGSWNFSKFKNIKISGILFEPYVQEPLTNFSIFFKKIRKRLQLNWMFLNKNIERVFIFNDDKAVEKLNSYTEFGTKFKYLPDPIKSRSFNKINIREQYNITNSKKVLLFIGGVQRRKNITVILEAVSLLNKQQSENVCLLILGKCSDKELLDEIDNKISNISNCQVIFDDKRLTNDELESSIVDADLAFVVYSNFYCSSGILGNIAKHNKYLIASNMGVIGEVTRKYNLGNTVNPNEVSEIKIAIVNFLSSANAFTNINNNAFVKEHTHIKFAEQLLSLK